MMLGGVPVNPTVRATLRVSTAELAYLIGLFGAEGLIGVDNPYAGWPIEEIEAELHRARAALAERGILSIDSDGRVSVSSDVGSIMTALAESAAVIVLTRTDLLGESETVSLHVHPDAIIEVRPEGKAAWIVTPVDEVVEHVWRGLGLVVQAVPGVPGGRLPHALLTRAREAALQRGLDDSVRVLQEALLAETASALAGTLADPLGNAAVAVMQRDPEGWKVDGLAFLEGPAGSWLMRTEGDSVQVEPCSVQAARAEISRLVERVSRRCEQNATNSGPAGSTA